MASERRFTAGLARFFGAIPGARVGIGDDAAVVPCRGRDVVACCDPVIAGVHFTSDAPAGLVGRKAVNRNLADLAAMGAVPDWLLVSLVLPVGYPATERGRLLRGIRAAARRGGCHVIGGDVATGPTLVVTVTALGHLAGRRPLQRADARIGDTLFVTGPLGGSAAGRHLRFAPPLAAGAWLATLRGVGAAMDISDGLLLDLATLLQASGGLGAELDAAAIPVHRDARRLCAGDAAAALARALGDGEDHELLFTVRRGRALPAGGPLSRVARRPIGRVLATPGLWLVGTDGRRRRLAPSGYQHALTGAAPA